MGHHFQAGLQGQEVLGGCGICLDTAKDSFEIEHLGQHVLQVRKLRHMGGEFFDTILTEGNPVHIGQRPFQPPFEQPRSHGGMGIVQKFQERSLPTAIPHVSRDFQVPQALFRQSKRMVFPHGLHRMERGGLCLHDILQVRRQPPENELHIVIINGSGGRRNVPFLLRFGPGHEAGPQPGSAEAGQFPIEFIGHRAYSLCRGIDGRNRLFPSSCPTPPTSIHR